VVALVVDIDGYEKGFLIKNYNLIRKVGL
jgi:hypothetical protein